MATANPISEDNFVLELNRVKERVLTKFREISEHLDEMKNELLRQINTLLVSYQTYKQEFQTTREKKKDLEKTKLYHQNELVNSPIKSVHDNYIVKINTELETIETPKQPKLVSFVCDKKKLLYEVNKLCKLVERVNGIDYKSKTQPIIRVCDRGDGDEQLHQPYVVTVDHNTGNMYVADRNNHCVKVFDNTAKYLFKFGEGMMSYPTGLLVHDNKVFVSHFNCILLYQQNGEFVSKIGGSGYGKLQFRHPSCMSMDESNNDIYICDMNNNRIQIIYKDLHYKSEFGGNTLDRPDDIQLYKDDIFILDSSNPCLHKYNKDLVLQESFDIRAIIGRLFDSYCFFIDKFGFILITGYMDDSIVILNSEFEVIHEISVSRPAGITMDREDRIIVMCHNSECLRIF